MSLLRPAMVLVAAALPLVFACGGQGSAPVVDAGAPAPDGGAEVQDAADASDAADADAAPLAPPLPSWSAEPFPDKRSPMPKKADWEAAPLVAIDRATPATLFQSREGGALGCRARRLLEWVQIHCEARGGMILLGGNADGISLGRDSNAVFPVRRGDRRMIEFLDADETVNAHTAEVIGRKVVPGFVVSEQWVAGDERPTLVAADHAVRAR